MDINIPIKCEKCGHVTTKPLAELQRQHDFTCRCGVTFTVNPDGFKTIGKSIADLQQALSKLGK